MIRVRHKKSAELAEMEGESWNQRTETYFSALADGRIVSLFEISRSAGARISTVLRNMARFAIFHESLLSTSLKFFLLTNFYSVSTSSCPTVGSRHGFHPLLVFLLSTAPGLCMFPLHIGAAQPLLLSFPVAWWLQCIRDAFRDSLGGISRRFGARGCPDGACTPR